MCVKTILKRESLDRLDLNLLSQWSMNQLPAELPQPFSVPRKPAWMQKKEASAYCSAHSRSLCGRLTPISVADAPIHVSNQMAMIARNLYIYDLEYMLKSMQRLVAGVGARNQQVGFYLYLQSLHSQMLVLPSRLHQSLVNAPQVLHMPQRLPLLSFQGPWGFALRLASASARWSGPARV